MKNLFFILFAAFLAVFTGFTYAQNSDKGTGTLKIIIDGFDNDKGSARIGLCNSKELFNDTEKGFRRSIAAIKDGKAECTFENIPLGKYTVKAYHYENNNEKLDKNMFGVPKERYGFSNNARATFGPPEFEEAQFTFDKPEMSLSIK